MALEAAALFVSLEARTNAFMGQMTAAQKKMQEVKKTAETTSTGVTTATDKASKANATSWEKSNGRVVQSFKTTGEHLKTTGSTLNRNVSLPLLAVGGYAVKLATNYEMVMNKVATLSSGSSKDIAMLRKRVLELGGATAKTPVELANALYIVESGGIKGGAAMKVLTASAKASAVGLGQVDVIARSVTGAVNAYAGTGLTAADATNTLAQAIKEGMVKADELAPVLGKLTSTTGFMGISFQSTMAAVAGLTRTGLDAAVATNQLRMVMLGFLKPTTKVVDALKSVGVTAQDVRTSFQKVGIQATMEMLWTAAGKGAKNVDEQKAKYAQFFQSIARGGSAALVLVGNNVKANEAIAKRMSTSVDVVGASFDRLRKQPGFQMQAGITQIKNDLIILGEVLLPIIAPAFVTVANKVQAALGWFKQLDPTVQHIILGFLGFMAALGPVLTVLGNVSTVISVMAANPALIAFAAAALLIATNWKTLAPVFSSIGDSAKSSFGTLKSLFSSVGDALGPIFNAVGGLRTLLSEVFGVAVVFAIGKAITAVKALWVAFSITPVGLLMTGIGLLVGAFMAVKGSQDAAKVSAQDLSAAWDKMRTSATAERDAILNVTQAQITLTAAKKADSDAINAMEAAATKYGKKSPEYIAALAAEQQTALDLTRATNGVTDSLTGVTSAHRTNITAIRDAIKADDQRRLTILQNLPVQDMMNAKLVDGKWIVQGNTTASKALNDVQKRLKADQLLLNQALNGQPKNIQTILGIQVNLSSNIAGVIQQFIAGGFSALTSGKAAGLPPGHALGGVVNSPGYFAGEEAPAHPEVILATNPAYRQRNLGLFAQAGSMLGVPGFAQGGITGNTGSAIGGIPGKVGAAAANWADSSAKALMKAALALQAAAGANQGHAGPTSGPKGTTSYNGILMAEWVAQTLSYVQGKGIFPSPTSGYRPGASEHGGTQYPHGAVDFGDYHSGGAMKRSVTAASTGFKYPLLNPIGFYDEGHASGTGHATGGIHHRNTHKRKAKRKPFTSGGLTGTRISQFGSHGAVGAVTAPPPELTQTDKNNMAISRIGSIWNSVKNFFPPGGQPSVDLIPPQTLSADPLRAGAQYAYALPPSQIAITPQFIDWFLDSQAPNNAWAQKTITHEFAHDFQSQDTLNSEWMREGGASAFASRHSAYGSVDDTNYDGFKAQVTSQLGSEWIERGQFGVGPTGVANPAVDATGALIGTVQAAAQYGGRKRKQAKRGQGGRYKAPGYKAGAVHKKPPAPKYLANIGSLNHSYPGHIGGGGTQFSPDLTAAIMEWAGLPGVTFSQIVHGESNYMPGNIEPREASGAQGWGLLQMTTGVGNDALINAMGGTTAMLNPIINAQAGKRLYDSAGGSISPWHGTGFVTGSNLHYGGQGIKTAGSAANTSTTPTASQIASTNILLAKQNALEVIKLAGKRKRYNNPLSAKIGKREKALATEPEIFKIIKDTRNKEQDLMEAFGHIDTTNAATMPFQLPDGTWGMTAVSNEAQIAALQAEEANFLLPAKTLLGTEVAQSSFGEAVAFAQQKKAHALSLWIRDQIKKTIAAIKAQWDYITDEQALAVGHKQQLLRERHGLQKVIEDRTNGWTGRPIRGLSPKELDKLHTAQGRLRVVNGELNKPASKNQHLANIVKAKWKIADLNKTLGVPASTNPGDLYGGLAASVNSEGVYGNTKQSLEQSVAYFQGDRKNTMDNSTLPAPFVFFNSVPDRARTISDNLNSLHGQLAALQNPTITPSTAGAGGVAAVGTAGSAASTTVNPMDAILAQQLAATQAINRTYAATSATLAQFTPPTAAPEWSTFLGSFATGIANVPMQGMAELHKGEAVIPASMNPFRSGASPGHVSVTLHGDASRFKDDVEVVIDGKTADIVSHVNERLGFGVGLARQTPSAPGRLARY